MNIVIGIIKKLISLPGGLLSLIREIGTERAMENHPDEPFKQRKRRGGGNHPKDLLGIQGEAVAKKYLRKKGFKILGHNVVMPSCELDLVVFDRKTDTLRFIEVKTRRSDKYEKPWQAVDRQRKIRMIAAAKEYIRQSRQWEKHFQFDIISIIWAENETPQIEHRENAFAPDRL